MKLLLPISLFGSWFASSGEITVVSLLTITLIGIIIYSYFFIKKKQKKEHIQLMKKKYDSYLLKLSLTDEELQFVNKLTKFLENDELKYHMLTNKRTFMKCAAELKKKEKYSKVLLDSLDRKLNFPAKKIVNNFFSSEDLPPGMPALIIIDDVKKISAVISENSRSSVSLKMKSHSIPLREGMPLNVYFHDNQKIFTINTTVLDHSEDILTISHSLLKSQKRRAFKRKKIKLPVVLKHTDFEEVPMHSYIIDLSEGGASTENPDFNFKKNERITLYYHIDTDDGFHLRGEIIRLSAKGRIIHIKFLDKDLTIRSRIKTIVK